MSTYKDMQDVIKQAQRISDSIAPKIPMSLVQQSKSWYAASKAFGPGRLTSASFKIPDPAIKRLECLGSAYKIPKPAIPKDALKGVRDHVMLSSAAYSIGSNSKLTELFDSGIIKSIQRQQKLFDSAHSLISTVNAFKSASINATSMFNAAGTVKQYLDSIKNLEHFATSFSIPELPEGVLSDLNSHESCDELLSSFSDTIVGEDYVDVPEPLTCIVIKVQGLPQDAIKESPRSGFVRFTHHVYKYYIAPIIVALAVYGITHLAPIVLDHLSDKLSDQCQPSESQQAYIRNAPIVDPCEISKPD